MRFLINSTRFTYSLNVVITKVNFLNLQYLLIIITATMLDYWSPTLSGYSYFNSMEEEEEDSTCSTTFTTNSKEAL